MSLEKMLEEYAIKSAEIGPKLKELKELEKKIKEHVRGTGEVISTDRVSVNVRPGSTRVSWDSKGLAGYAVANPDILAFRSESVSKSVVTIKVAQ